MASLCHWPLPVGTATAIVGAKEFEHLSEPDTTKPPEIWESVPTLPRKVGSMTMDAALDVAKQTLKRQIIENGGLLQ